MVMMKREVAKKQTWGAVAPSRHVSRRTSSSSFPRLETILEEGGVEYNSSLSKKVFLVLPIALSTAFWVLLCKDGTTLYA
ncbi:hypothetical protein CCACVL1_18972 [Corchorus capsularis]|uniref:Uncharacterized protein n=1 Tax=Corchorus capsularis TaxID=210143 RepID=A0A1R3HJ50_COCAP|nr:hypothetical protein CCACVL1_18972 [Corchorus capsularis]